MRVRLLIAASAMVLVAGTAPAATVVSSAVIVDYVEIKTTDQIDNAAPPDERLRNRVTSRAVGRLSIAGDFRIEDDLSWSTIFGESYEFQDDLGGVGGFSFAFGRNDEVTAQLNSGDMARSLEIDGRVGVFEYEDDGVPVFNRVRSNLQIFGLTTPTFSATYQIPVTPVPLPAGGLMLLSGVALAVAVRRRCRPA